MSGVSPEMGRKKLSGDRDLKVCSAPGGNNSSRSYDGHNIGFVHSYQTCMETLKTESHQTSFSASSKNIFLQPNILLKPLFACSNLRKSVATADLGWFLPDLTAEMYIKGSQRGKARALCKKSDTNQSAPHGEATIKGSTKTVKVRAEEEI